MRVFGLTTGADTAGINVAISRAFKRHAPDWDVRSMVATVNYIEYPVDVAWDLDRLRELYDAADVVMLHNTLHGHGWYDNAQGKPTVLMHHGMKNGSDRPFASMVRDARSIDVVQVGSTLDLALREPDVQWLPAPVDLAAMRSLRASVYRPSSEYIRVGHAPTARDIKGSDAFDAAMARLAERYPVKPVVISGRPWRECLRRKAGVDVFFDQPTLGYGSNAIEAWAMGIPVISGISDPFIRDGMLQRWGVLPFYEANEATLYDALRAMVADTDLQAEYAQRGTAHVERWHDERVTVESLKAIYQKAPRSVPGPAHSARRVPRWIALRDRRRAQQRTHA